MYDLKIYINLSYYATDKFYYCSSGQYIRIPFLTNQLTMGDLFPFCLIYFTSHIVPLISSFPPYWLVRAD